MSKWLGLDVGGANLKVADAHQLARQSPFALWKSPNRLANELSRLLEGLSEYDAVALTMTGEMADCFATREEGVCRILEQLTRIVPSPCVRVYTVEGDWLTVTQAARESWRVAASNWMALASYALRWTEAQPTLLVDVGSTTTDIIALNEDRVLSDSRTDRERLVSGELVYTGVERSSVVGIVQELNVHGALCPVINESFATSGDVNLVLGYLDEDTADCDTCDGQAKTRAHAAYRLARTVGEDGSTLGLQDIEAMAEKIYGAQVAMIASRMEQVSARFKSQRCNHLLYSGHGDFLIEDAVASLGWKVRVTRLSDQLGPKVSRCAPAHAVAVLATERNDE